MPRLSSGPSRGPPVTLDFEGESVPAFDGEPVACSLLAAGHPVFSRSTKYHRPRGPFCFAAACSHCLMRVDGVPNLYTCLQIGSTLRFVSRFAKALIEQAPILGQVKVLRHWAGCYDVTPDNSPILGRTPTIPNLLQMSGFVGHGFMMAPAIAERMATWMLEENSDALSRATISPALHGASSSAKR